MTYVPDEDDVDYVVKQSYIDVVLVRKVLTLAGPRIEERMKNKLFNDTNLNYILMQAKEKRAEE